jgi:hypothetical protein
MKSVNDRDVLLFADDSRETSQSATFLVNGHKLICKKKSAKRGNWKQPFGPFKYDSGFSLPYIQSWSGLSACFLELHRSGVMNILWRK